MTDLQILSQLLNGYHLEPKQLERAQKLLIVMNNEIKNRTSKVI